MCCNHFWKEYVGLTGLNNFRYCGECGVKESEVDTSAKEIQLEFPFLHETVNHTGEDDCACTYCTGGLWSL